MDKPDPDIGSPEPDIGSPEPDIGSPEPDIGSPEPDIGSPEPDIGSPEPDTGSPEPDNDSAEPDIGSPEQAYFAGVEILRFRRGGAANCEDKVGFRSDLQRHNNLSHSFKSRSCSSMKMINRLQSFENHSSTHNRFSP